LLFLESLSGRNADGTGIAPDEMRKATIYVSIAGLPESRAEPWADEYETGMSSTEHERLFSPQLLESY
jgi:hypothetical protein